MPPAPPVTSPYATLGVSPTASQHTIKAAYRRLALAHHPDRNPTDIARATERFKGIGAAFALIGTASARVAYDERERRKRAQEAPRPAPRPTPRRRAAPPVDFCAGLDDPPPPDLDDDAPPPPPPPRRRRPVRYAGFEDFGPGGDPVSGAGVYPDEGRMYGEAIFEGDGGGMPEEDDAAEGGAVDWEDDDGV